MSRHSHPPGARAVAACLAVGAIAFGAPSDSVAAPFARGLSTDRPDQTESPYTVEPGHWQVELQAVSFGGDAAEDVSSSQWMGVNVKAGIARRLDLQIVTTGFLRARVAGNGHESGIGDLMARLKWNLVGNDDPGPAVALMPFVTWPTGASAFTAHEVEGGLLAAAAFPLEAPWGFGAMVQGDWKQDGDGDGTHAEWLLTATLNRPIAGPLGGFVEHVQRFRLTAEGEREAYVDIGATYGLGPDAQLDMGTQWGLTDASEDWRVLVGFSIRR